METLASAFIYRHTKVRITTERPTEFIDLTDSLEELLAESRIVTGFVNVQSLHTTAAIVVNEGEPLLLDDFECFLRKTAPDDATRDNFIEYGRRLEKLIAEVKGELARAKQTALAGAR